MGISRIYSIKTKAVSVLKQPFKLKMNLIPEEVTHLIHMGQLHSLGRSHEHNK